jgi:hypothetical protein
MKNKLTVSAISMGLLASSLVYSLYAQCSSPSDTTGAYCLSDCNFQYPVNEGGSCSELIYGVYAGTCDCCTGTYCGCDAVGEDVLMQEWHASGDCESGECNASIDDYYGYVEEPEYDDFGDCLGLGG